MSRIGREPIVVPAGVTVTVAEGNNVTVKGPLGELNQSFHKELTIAQEGDKILVTRPNDEKENRSLHGLTRTLLNNMIVGVTKGFENLGTDSAHGRYGAVGDGDFDQHRPQRPH